MKKLDNTREYGLSFIGQTDFEQHVKNTLTYYQTTLQSINLERFNQNIVDPIKLLFDKEVHKKTYEEIIEFEIQRQRDKSNNNSIGYFHQNLFNYIRNCSIPKEGWDVIAKVGSKTYYVEMKNKHNTMNSSSSAKTYIKMQNHLLTTEEDSICALVEVIAVRSQDIPWIVTIDKVKQQCCERLRRISIDKFYELVTGDPNSFKNICLQLPYTIKKLLQKHDDLQIPKDTVLQELNAKGDEILISLYRLAFSTYEGFSF